MQKKEEYTLKELYNNLPISISELGRKSNINEVTLARIRDGKAARRHTLVKLLHAFSDIYGTPITFDNVIDINLLVGRYGEGKDSQQEEAA